MSAIPTSGVSSTAIVLAVDSGYLEFVPCMLGQLSVHAQGAPVVLVVAADVDVDLLRNCRDIAARLGLSLTVVDAAHIKALESEGRIAARDYVSAFTYAKLMFPELLPDLDQILYLDVDILIRGDLSPLLNWDLRHPLGAVPEVGVNGMHIHGNVRVPYFNAGVLRMSLARMREEGLWEQALEVITRRPRLRYQDQDVFNICFHDRFDALPLTFNVFNSVSMSHPQLKLFSDPTLVHFTGPGKPWRAEVISPFAREWRALNADVMQMDAEQSEHYVRGIRLQEQSVSKRAVERLRATGPIKALRETLPLSVKIPLHRILYAPVPEAKGVSRPRAVGNRPPVSRRMLDTARYSPPGRTLRTHLPLEVKRPISRAMWKIAPRGPRQPPVRIRLTEGARHSATGMAVREHLPMTVKRPLSKAMYRTVLSTPQTRRQRAQRKRQEAQQRQAERQRAMRSGQRTGESQQRLTHLLDRVLGERQVVVSGPPLPPDAMRLTLPTAPVPIEVPDQAPVPEGVVAPTRRARGGATSATPGALRLLISQARSGTNAMGHLMAGGFEEVEWIGEVYAGFLRSNHPDDITDAFEWIGELETARSSGAIRPETTAWNDMLAQYRLRMSAEAIPVTEHIISKTGSICAAKIFDDHLTDEALEDLFAYFRPPLLVQRRVYLYSLVSWLKARSTQRWAFQENTSAPIEFNERVVRRYVERGERWHWLVAELAARYELPVSFVTYEGLFERRDEIKVLRDFFADATPTEKARSDDSWLAPSPIQDRRTDQSLSVMMEQFSRLPSDLREQLLRLPGEQAWAQFQVRNRR